VAGGRLEPVQVQTINAPLDQALLRNAMALPEHIRVLGQFPRALSAIENELKPHLEILRTIARQFNTFDDEVFTYFFAQYYAQQSYKGNALKVAPISERRFDEPFDSLDEYFRAWGEGHSTTEILVGQVHGKPSPPLCASYLPQYQVGKLKMLPYTPLSLDSLHLPEKNHLLVQQTMIGLDDRNQTVEQVASLLAETPLVQRNRLLSDLLSFVQLCAKLWGVKGLTEQSRALGYSGFDEFVQKWPPLLATSFRQELELEKASSVAEVWETWLKTSEVEREPNYVPVHVFFLLFENSDWDSDALSNAAELVQLARFVYQGIV
jgi:hypothetical protein